MLGSDGARSVFVDTNRSELGSTSLVYSSLDVALCSSLVDTFEVMCVLLKINPFDTLVL